MSHTHLPPPVPEGANLRPKITGLALKLVRVTWLALAALVVVVFIAAINPRLSQLASIPPIHKEYLDNLGVSFQFYVIFKLAIDFVVLLGFLSASVVLFWSRSDDWMALLVSVALMTFGLAILPGINQLAVRRPDWQLAVNLVRGIGISTALLSLYLFPDGCFTPRWTRLMAYFWSGWLVIWVILPVDLANPQSMSTFTRLFTFWMFSPTFLEQMENLRRISLAFILIAWFGSGMVAQVARFKHNSTPAQQRQTKGIVLGLVIAFLGYIAYSLPPAFYPDLRQASLAALYFDLLGFPLYSLSLLAVPVLILISISLFRLWDVDLLINRVLVYGGLTLLLGAFYIGEILLIQWVFGSLTQSPMAVAISTLIFAALFSPLYRRMQNFVDRRFYRERIDFRKEFTGFSRLVRTIIELPELLHVLVERTTALLHAQHGAVLLYRQQQFELAESQGLGEAEKIDLKINPSQMGQLLANEPVLMPRNSLFELLVPLTALRSEVSNKAKGDLVGVLALGPRLSGLGYSNSDRELLLSLADQAGTAIYVAQVVHEREEETLRREQAERSLENYRASPAGQAEVLAEQLLEEPSAALEQIYHLAQESGKNPTTAAVLGSLPNALHGLSAHHTDQALLRTLQGLAEAYQYFYNGQITPELIPVGLRSLIVAALSPAGKNLPGMAATAEIYQRCHLAIEANSIPQITGAQETGSALGNGETTTLSTGFHFSNIESIPFLQPLINGLDDFHAVTAALRAYERVDTTQDKLAYLAGAVERLRHIERSNRNELGSADRGVVGYIAESWLAVVTGAISELQTRARLVCQLLTRHTWQDDVISVSLNIRNEGQGAALNVRVTLSPDPDYSAVDNSATVQKLAFGEEQQISLRVRPRPENTLGQFRIRFIILYTDPRGPDQVENYADVIHLLSTGGEFQFIPNPYVVGTPLQAGSPLFFGREDVFEYIQSNLEALHRNNLVLIGQRRTGKTSLLKQLPVRLNDEYLPVYLDGQSLGLDPGLPNFFLNLATEIAFAVEDRGLEIAMPELQDFHASPAQAFERNFLTKVRQAIGNRHLLIMLDEFEELESAVRRGDLEPSIFGFLRHLIQHSENLSVIFCGTHRMEELASDYWNVLFNISIYRHIALLEREEAFRLVQNPVERFGMRYDDLALDKIWRVTAGHPYFMQLLCHSLVNRHNKTERNYVTIGDVNAALDEILASGEAHFVYLWTSSSPLEKLTLTAFSRLASLNGQAAPVQITDYLEERGVTVERASIHQALHQLALRDILTARRENESSGDVYRWKLGLLSMWVEKYKSLSRVVDEVGA